MENRSRRCASDERLVKAALGNARRQRRRRRPWQRAASKPAPAIISERPTFVQRQFNCGGDRRSNELLHVTESARCLICAPSRCVGRRTRVRRRAGRAGGRAALADFRARHAKARRPPLQTEDHLDSCRSPGGQKVPTFAPSPQKTPLKRSQLGSNIAASRCAPFLSPPTKSGDNAARASKPPPLVDLRTRGSYRTSLPTACAARNTAAANRRQSEDECKWQLGAKKTAQMRRRTAKEKRRAQRCVT